MSSINKTGNTGATTGTIIFTVGDVCSQHNSVQKVVGGTVSLTSGSASYTPKSITANSTQGATVDVTATYDCNGKADNQSLTLQYNNGNSTASATKAYNCPCVYTYAYVGSDYEYTWEWNSTYTYSPNNWKGARYGTTTGCEASYDVTATKDLSVSWVYCSVSPTNSSNGSYTVSVYPSQNTDQSFRSAVEAITVETSLYGEALGHITCYQNGKPYVNWIAPYPSDLSWSTTTGATTSAQSPGGSAVVMQNQKNETVNLRNATISLGEIKGTNANHFEISGSNITPKSSNSAGTYTATAYILASDPVGAADTLTRTVNLTHVVSEPNVKHFRIGFRFALNGGPDIDENTISVESTNTPDIDGSYNTHDLNGDMNRPTHDFNLIIPNTVTSTIITLKFIVLDLRTEYHPGLSWYFDITESTTGCNSSWSISTTKPNVNLIINANSGIHGDYYESGGNIDVEVKISLTNMEDGGFFNFRFDS